MLKGNSLLKHSLFVELDNLYIVGIFGKEGCNSHSEGVMGGVGEGNCEDIPGCFVRDNLVVSPPFLLHDCLCHAHAYFILTRSCSKWINNLRRQNVRQDKEYIKNPFDPIVFFKKYIVRMIIHYKDFFLKRDDGKEQLQNKPKYGIRKLHLLLFSFVKVV